MKKESKEQQVLFEIDEALCELKEYMIGLAIKQRKTAEYITKKSFANTFLGFTILYFLSIVLTYIQPFFVICLILNLFVLLYLLLFRWDTSKECQNWYLKN